MMSRYQVSIISSAGAAVNIRVNAARFDLEEQCTAEVRHHRYVLYIAKAQS